MSAHDRLRSWEDRKMVPGVGAAMAERAGTGLGRGEWISPTPNFVNATNFDELRWRVSLRSC